MIHSEVFYDVVGAIGAFLILLGFYRTSIGRWKNKSVIYELDNLMGALFLMIYQLHHHAFISMTVNVIWAIIAFTGLTSFAQRYTKRSRRKTHRKA